MKKLIQTVLKVMQVVAATAMLSALLPMSPAAANVEANIGTNFDEAALYSPVVSRDFANAMQVDVDDEGNIYTASTVLQTQDLTHARNMGVTEALAVGRGVKHGNNLVVTKVDKDGQLVWVWELRAVSGNKQFGWWDDIAVAPDGTVHVVGYYKGFGHAWHHKAGDTPRPSINEDGTLIDGDYIMDYTPTQSLGQWVTINADGTTRHIKGLKSKTSSYFESVDVDSNGDVLIAGRNHGQTWMDMNDHTGATVNSDETTPYIGKYEANGDLIWSRRLNKCGDYKHSSAWDAKFASDGRIAIVGAYSGTPTWSCAQDGGKVVGRPGPGAYELGHSFANHLTLGTRSYMASMTSDGAVEYVREFGSVTQRSSAQQIVEHPVTGDLFILGLWEDTITNPDDCGDGTPTDDRWFFAPAKPSADFPLIGDHSRFTRSGGVELCSAHEGGGVNDDHYLLHTDSLGNLKNHKLLDVHLEKVYGPSLAINSDGSEIALVDAGVPQSAASLAVGKSGGSNGWVVALDTSDLSENWRWINQNYTDPLLDDSKVDKYAFSWTHGVAYGPEDKVHVTGRTQWSTLFGVTANGTDGTQIKTTRANTDAFVARYTLDGLLDNGVPAEVPQVAPDGYSIITPQTFQDEDGTYLIGPGGEVVWNEPLCAGGRWQVTPQLGIAVRHYMVSKDDVSGATAEEVLADAIRISHSGPDGTIPNYNILWQDGYDLDADGSSADHPDLFKVLGWDTGVADLDVADDLPVGFYFRQNMFEYNTNHDGRVPPRFSPENAIDGHTWDLDDYDVYLAFAHPGGTTDPQPYPKIFQACPPAAGITISKDGLATSETGTSDSFTVVLDSKPTAPVQILLANTDTTEVSVDKSLLWFYTYNWNTAQTVTVTGKGDGSPDGDITSYVNVSVNHDASSYEYASIVNQIVDVVNENIDLLPPPPNPDLDGDGILNEDEVDGCVENADCDGDGINDGNEIPACILVADCDGDGLDDNKELVGCIQDPRCTDDNGNPISDEKPVVPETKPIEPDNPPAPPEPEVTEPDDDSKPQEDLIPDVVEDTDLDSDGDGIADVDELPGCELTDDCDGDGIEDGEDSEPSNPDVDGDGLPDGFDPDPSNPDTDGDGVPDGEDDDSDGNGIPDDDEQNGPGSGLQEPNLTITDNETDPAAPTDPDGPSQTPKDSDDDSDSPAVVRVLTDPKVIVGGGVAAAAGFAWLWFLARAIGFSNGLWWLLWLLLRRRRFCKICDCTLKKTKDGVWISVESGSHLGEDDHVHEPKFLRRVKPTPES